MLYPRHVELTSCTGRKLCSLLTALVLLVFFWLAVICLPARRSFRPVVMQMLWHAHFEESHHYRQLIPSARKALTWPPLVFVMGCGVPLLAQSHARTSEAWLKWRCRLQRGKMAQLRRRGWSSDLTTFPGQSEQARSLQSG